ncbi:unnamed protein product, partial [Strongylus vulgaris]
RQEVESEIEALLDISLIAEVGIKESVASAAESLGEALAGEKPGDSSTVNASGRDAKKTVQFGVDPRSKKAASDMSRDAQASARGLGDAIKGQAGQGSQAAKDSAQKEINVLFA